MIGANHETIEPVPRGCCSLAHLDEWERGTKKLVASRALSLEPLDSQAKVWLKEGLRLAPGCGEGIVLTSRSFKAGRVGASQNGGAFA